MDAAVGGVFADYAYRAVTGGIGGATRVASIGYNADIDTATVPEDVWSGSSVGTVNAIDHKLIQFPPAGGVSMEVVSNSPSDTAAGAGARTVSITYLDANYVSTTVTLTLNGTTPVALGTVLRINAFTVSTAGTTPRGVNIGNLSIRATGGLGATYSYMLAGIGFAQSSLFTVPAGASFDVLAALGSLHQVDTSQRAGTMSLAVQNSAGRLIKALFFGLTSNVNYVQHANGIPITTVPATFDTWLICENVSANNTAVSGSLFGYTRTGAVN
jgi:hypothetical protein